jgi:hypothetical protein
MEVDVNGRAAGGGSWRHNQLEAWLDRLQPQFLETGHKADVCPDG